MLLVKFTEAVLETGCKLEEELLLSWIGRHGNIVKPSYVNKLYTANRTVCQLISSVLARFCADAPTICLEERVQREPHALERVILLSSVELNGFLAVLIYGDVEVPNLKGDPFT